MGGYPAWSSCNRSTRSRPTLAVDNHGGLEGLAAVLPEAFIQPSVGTVVRF